MQKSVIQSFDYRKDGLHVRYFIAGKGRSLFIVPPFHADIDRLKPFILALARRRKVIVPELPGIATYEPLPHGFSHSSASYAKILRLLILHLHLQSYDIFSLSFGGIITAYMMQMSFPMPQCLFIYGMPYKSKYIHPEPHQRLALGLYKLFRWNNTLALWFMKNIYCNRTILAMVLGIRYIGFSDYVETVKAQIRLTTTMNPRAGVEIFNELMSLDLSTLTLHCRIPAIIIYNKEDIILDVAPTSAGVQKLFVNSQVLLLPGKFHAPAGRISQEYVKKMMRSLEQWMP